MSYPNGVDERLLPVITEGTDPRVEACGEHVWRLEDRAPASVIQRSDEYLCDICQNCRAIRCSVAAEPGLPRDKERRCLEARHHNGRPHRFPGGGTRGIGA